MTQADSVVISTGDPTLDVPAVQAAVDRGGTVLLKGTFDFGESDGVSIKTDVEVCGETVGGPFWDASPDLARGTVTVSENTFDGMFREADPDVDPWAARYRDGNRKTQRLCGGFWDYGRQGT
jgi:hypothetical protein